MNEQVVVVQVFIQVAFLFRKVGRERRSEEGGAPGRQNGVSNLEQTQTIAGIVVLQKRIKSPVGEETLHFGNFTLSADKCVPNACHYFLKPLR